MGPATGAATVDGRVVGVVVVGAVPGAGIVPPVGIAAAGRGDDVLGVAVGRLSGVTEVGRGGLGLQGQLVPGGTGAGHRSGVGRAVVPDAGQHVAGRIGDGLGGRPARGGAHRHTVAVLGDRAAPQLPGGAQAAIEDLEGARLAVGVVGEGGPTRDAGPLGPPLAAQEHQVDPGRPGGHPGPAQAARGEPTAVGDELVAPPGGSRRRLRRGEAGDGAGGRLDAGHGPVTEPVVVAGGVGQAEPGRGGGGQAGVGGRGPGAGRGRGQAGPQDHDDRQRPHRRRPADPPMALRRRPAPLVAVMPAHASPRCPRSAPPRHRPAPRTDPCRGFRPIEDDLERRP